VKGIIFNLIEEIVRKNHGERTWDNLLKSAKLEGAYTSLGSYPDGHLTALVGAASAQFKQSGDSLVRWIGRNALPLLALKYPHFFTPHRTTRAFLLTLNDVIHAEVRKLYPGANVPEFVFGSTPEGDLLMQYRSQRRLCSFAEGLIEGSADHYGESVLLRHDRCMKRGDDHCFLQLSFSSKPSA
jgi:hypothetical protein